MIFKVLSPESGALLFNEQAEKAKKAKHAISRQLFFFDTLTNTIEIKMQAPGLIGELGLR
ncbi:MAG: hypothetical protein ACLUIQ_07575 [Dialister invisus]